MVYGGTIRPGSCQGLPQLDIVSAFQSYGLYLAHGKSPQAESIRYNTVRHACPGPGACGGVRPPFLPPLSLSLTPSFPDVYRKHHGQCCRSPRNDPPRLFLFPCRVSRKTRRMCRHRPGHVQPPRKKFTPSRHHDSLRLRKCHRTPFFLSSVSQLILS